MPSANELLTTAKTAGRPLEAAANKAVATGVDYVNTNAQAPKVEVSGPKANLGDPIKAGATPTLQIKAPPTPDAAFAAVASDAAVVLPKITAAGGSLPNTPPKTVDAVPNFPTAAADGATTAGTGLQAFATDLSGNKPATANLVLEVIPTAELNKLVADLSNLGTVMTSLAKTQSSVIDKSTVSFPVVAVTGGGKTWLALDVGQFKPETFSMETGDFDGLQTRFFEEGMYLVGELVTIVGIATGGSVGSPLAPTSPFPFPPEFGFGG